MTRLAISPAILALSCALLSAPASVARGQIPFRPLPIEKIEKPKERTTAEPVRPRARTVQPPSTGEVTVLLNPIVQGQVIVRDENGKQLQEESADENGEASFSLLRGRRYEIEATSPGFSPGITSFKLIGRSSTIRLSLTAESRILKLAGLPEGAEVLIDDAQVRPSLVGGVATIAGLAAGKHRLIIQHPEYSQFAREIDLSPVSAGEAALLLITLEKTARIEVASLPGASVMLDGVFKGVVPQTGSLNFEQPLNEPSEHMVSVEMIGYQKSALKHRLVPGRNKIEVNLDPIITDAGTTDGFDNLSQWQAPASWQTPLEGNNRRLRVAGSEPGQLKNKVFRDFRVNFLLWMEDGKGASWVVRPDKESRNYYLFHLAGPNSEMGTPNRFYTFIVEDGGEPREVLPPTPLVTAIDPEASYTIDIRINGHHIEHWITSNVTGDEDSLGSFTCTDPERDKFLYGSFGFRALKGEVFLIDDLSIKTGEEAATARP